MTRPMPDPPECVCGQCITPKCPEYPHTWSAHCPVHKADAHDAAPKHLTDAECAAEYWRALYDVARPLAAGTFIPSADWNRDVEEAAAWRRFATHPHAFKETHDDRP